MAAPKHGAASLPSSEDGMTVIGEGIHVHGRITGEEDLRIEGRVEGSISLTETVHVAESGVVVATIQARDVVVSGVVVGNVSATNAVHLNPGAKLVGDIDAPRLIISDGAAFRGNVAMGTGSEAAAARAKAAAAAPVSRPSVAARPRPASRTTTASRPAARPAAAPPRGERPARASEAAPAAPRVAAIRPPRPAGAPDDEVTVVVRHAALAEEEAEGTDAGKGTATATKKIAKKVPPRGRVPKPGKRTVTRR